MFNFYSACDHHTENLIKAPHQNRIKNNLHERFRSKNDNYS